MDEVRRRDIRLQLGVATCISFAIDDRESQQIIRLRCEAPDYPYACSGVLGAMSLRKSAVADFEEDHALIAVRKSMIS